MCSVYFFYVGVVVIYSIARMLALAFLLIGNLFVHVCSAVYVKFDVPWPMDVLILVSGKICM